MGEKDKWCGIMVLYHGEADLKVADLVSQGIEEEGIPYRLEMREKSAATASSLAHGPGLGVAVEINRGTVEIYCRQFKEDGPLFILRQGAKGNLRVVGQNAARIVKGRPFLDIIDG